MKVSKSKLSVVEKQRDTSELVLTRAASLINELLVLDPDIICVCARDKKRIPDSLREKLKTVVIDINGLNHDNLEIK